MEKVLLDTDVILDFFFDRQPFSEDASQLLSLCELNKLKGYVTPVCLSNVYYILRKVSTHQRVIDKLKTLMQFIDLSAINKEAVLAALDSGFNDFEDALQHFSALKEKGISAIITRNIKDYRKSNLSVMTPETFLKTIQF